jgi:predicted amidohydrolase YtcJ
MQRRVSERLLHTIRICTLASLASLLLAPPIVGRPIRAAEIETSGPANLVLTGGKLVTMDESRPLASALAAQGDRIIAVGDDAAVQPLVGPATRVIQLEGKLVLPGFIEGHGHFLDLGESKRTLDLTRARDWEQIVALVAEAARKAPAGTWIVGQGWHQSHWDRPPEPNVEGYPFHEKLSRQTPDHPVLLTHGTGHMCLANAKAMELAGVDGKTPDPPGGQILRDPQGRAIGAFRETAAGLIERAYERSRANRTPAEIASERDEQIRLATAECLSKGVTTFHDAGEPFAVIDHFRRLAERGELKVRLWVMIGDSPDALAKRLPKYRLIGLGNNHLTVRAIKEFMDGALGTHGAWLLEPYNDVAGVGMAVTPPETIRRVARLAIEHGFQLCTHAIGDRANRQVLDIYQEVFREHPDRTGLRWRIEHAQHLNPADIPRFGQLGVIASMQGCHATSDGPFVVTRLGPRRAQEGAYAWQPLLRSGAMIVNGSDVPVEDMSPILCFYSSVTRKMADGRPFFPEHCMTRPQALRSYTLDTAYAGFEEHIKGSLTPGKLADVVVLSKDIMTVPAAEIPQAEALYTIVGGKVLFERGSGKK